MKMCVYILSVAWLTNHGFPSMHLFHFDRFWLWIWRNSTPADEIWGKRGNSSNANRKGELRTCSLIGPCQISLLFKFLTTNSKLIGPDFVSVCVCVCAHVYMCVCTSCVMISFGLDLCEKCNISPALGFQSKRQWLVVWKLDNWFIKDKNCITFHFFFFSAGLWQGICEAPWTECKGKCNQRLVWHQIPDTIDNLPCRMSVSKYLLQTSLCKNDLPCAIITMCMNVHFSSTLHF